VHFLGFNASFTHKKIISHILEISMDLNFRDPKLNKEKFINLVLFNRAKRHFLLKNCRLICKNLTVLYPKKISAATLLVWSKDKPFLQI
jgi:hypothetical protein